MTNPQILAKLRELLAEESVNGFKPRALTRALERFFTTELEGYERASA